ncbi:DUF6194 family protein [Rhodovulum sp. FJ3]|uniref:DUF6194 family protein n=1 Tax=Rhodovulum sp. FJ3 TaxID=3079053 RepID=UPI00293DF218|nr:DUF6194 family protein [Rhodovulum sp. FJ3]MDV4169547.1 DUF6194 family protein [Rhodovulum sp. FJ3]
MGANPTPDSIIEHLLDRFEGTRVVEAWGERSIFYNPGLMLPRGVYFATVKEKDGENDKASHLDRAGVFRLNVGTTKSLFLERFGPPPSRPGKGGVVDGPWDFTAADTLTPHPVYGWMSWVAVLNPSNETLSIMNEIVEAAFGKAKASFEKKVR